MSADDESGGEEKAAPTASKLGRFIQTYHGFLSSFVIGVAGLVATSIWQYRQSQIAAQQAHSEQVIAQTKAENDWRIARAEILSKNLNVLSAQGPGSADQRFGVLLSLTRGAIIDPELAVSYAMELGKDNPTYMRTVLEATGQKNYQQLAQGFKLTCAQRFGVQRAADICKDDALAERSDAIAQVVADEMDATAAVHGAAAAGPMAILREEREVQTSPGKLEWLFEPYLEDLYDRRVWQEIERFEDFSTGAHLVAALALSTARTGEMVSTAEASLIEKFHADHRKWLASYLLGTTCGGDCRGKLVNAMLTGYVQAQGDYDEPFRRLLIQPRAEAASAFAHLHTRFLWCQVDAAAEAQFRDSVLVPAFNEALPDPSKPPPKNTAAAVEDLVDLLALVPEPPASDAAATAAWKKVMAELDHSVEHLGRTYNARRAASARERSNPPPMIRKVNFCGAPPAPAADTPGGAKP
ncbi:MAG TPA: hypothetical protein VN853_13800 [Polyangia bacterium]|nr:hypothetical protein [Polyangia bacterium]